jgi:hypothetical protein
MASTPRSSWRTASATLALLAVMSMVTLPLLHGLGEDDPCTPGAAAHDAASHGIRAAPASETPHCAVCHFWQSVSRFGRPSLPTIAVPVLDFGIVARVSTVAPEPADVTSRPARAPPSA